jgi:hypothetical protein
VGLQINKRAIRQFVRGIITIAGRPHSGMMLGGTLSFLGPVPARNTSACRRDTSEVAAKYGSLSRSTGRVFIDWELDGTTKHY